MTRSTSAPITVAALVLVACSGKGSAGEGHDDPVEFGRVPALSGSPLASGPGHLEGAMAVGAVRAGPAAAVFQSLPMPRDVVRELAEAGSALGGDFRVGDLPARFGVAPDALITFSIGRPLDGRIAEIRRTLEARPEWFGALEAHRRANEQRRDRGIPEVVVTLAGDPAGPPPPRTFGAHEEVAEVATVEAAKVDPQPVPEAFVDPFAAEKTAVGETVRSPDLKDPFAGGGRRLADPFAAPPVPPPAPKPPIVGPDVEDVRRAMEFVERASTLAYHSRVHIPTTKPGWLRDLAVAEGWDPTRHSDRRACDQFRGPTDLCTVSGDTVLVARGDAGGLTIDIVVFEGYPERWTPEHDALAIDAVRASATPSARVSGMYGDAGVFVDGAAVARGFNIDRIGRAARSLDWDPNPGLRRVRALETIRESGRVYAGITLEASLGTDAIITRGTWVPLNAETAAATSKLLARERSAAPVPSIDALCAGSVACFRTTGAPDFANASAVLTGFWSAPLETVFETLDDGNEFGAMSVFLESWPTMLAAMSSSPIGGGDMGGQMAVGMARESARRLTGFGGSLRSLSVGRRSAQMDYVAYARATAADLASVKGLSSFTGGEVRFDPASIDGVNGPVDVLRVHDADVPVTAYLVRNAGDQTTAPAWAVIGDADDRLRWMFGLPTDDGERPAAYAEIPDVWRLFSAERHLEREFSFASSWLQGRELRVQVDRVGPAPLVRAVLRTRPPSNVAAK